jgi:hypothetical protein
MSTASACAARDRCLPGDAEGLETVKVAIEGGRGGIGQRPGGLGVASARRKEARGHGEKAELVRVGSAGIELSDYDSDSD